MNVALLTIGDELLIGQTVNTNAAWMGKSLSEIGLRVVENRTIKDTVEDIVKSLDDLKEKADLILVTGGLGPTKDDVTKHTLCEYFNTELVLNEEVLAGIESYFKAKGREMLQANIDQALLPKKAKILKNKLGTASGMWFTENEKHVISLPGVPYEMKHLMTEYILPEFGKENQSNIYHHTVKTIGVGESYLAVIIAEWENTLREEGLTLAYLPSPGIVKLRISCDTGSESHNKKRVHHYADQLYDIIPKIIYGVNDQELSEVIGIELQKKQKTLGVCESCTGGYLAHLLTSIPGSSAYFEGSVVSYSYDLKESLLNVDKNTLIHEGAVSEKVVKQMVEGGLKNLNVDYCIAVSGIAGPGGGTPEKPVGTVCMAVGNKDKIVTFTHHFKHDRARNIHLSAVYALNELRKFLLESATKCAILR